jgi:hypothetical protein
MTTKLNFGRDVQGMNAYAPQTSSNKYSATLASGTASTIIAPLSSANWIVAFSFQPGTTVWVDLTGATAAVPSGGTLSSTTAELLPGQRLITGGSSISMITANTSADVGVLLYAVP